MTTFRPMLSATCEDISKVRLPAMASPKLDGFRCVIKDGKPLTRNLKPIPNRHVRERLTGLPAFDGERRTFQHDMRSTAGRWNSRLHSSRRLVAAAAGSYAQPEQFRCRGG